MFVRIYEETMIMQRTEQGFNTFLNIIQEYFPKTRNSLRRNM